MPRGMVGKAPGEAEPEGGLPFRLSNLRRRVQRLRQRQAQVLFPRLRYGGKEGVP